MPNLTHCGTPEVEAPQSLAEDTRDALVAVCNRLRYINIVAQMSDYKCKELQDAEKLLQRWIDHERS